MDMATVHQLSRRAVAGDLPAILRVDRVAASGDRKRSEFLRHCLALGECRVYVVDEVVAGFVIVLPEHFFGRDFIELLVVDPDRRRAGIGRILLRDAVAAAGTARVFTSTNASNRPMRALLATEDWSFSGGLGGLDEDDSELVFYKDRPAGPASRTE
jgi:GNAT superfamily N-acetyltransferase